MRGPAKTVASLLLLLLATMATTSHSASGGAKHALRIAFCTS